MFLAAKEFPLPIEYRFLPLEEVFHEPPADMADRTAIFLDCGNIDRMPVDFLTTAPTRSSTSTITTTTPISATSTWSTSAPPAPPRSSTSWRCCSGSDHAGDGLGALRRTDHRHRQVHVREHQRPDPPDRRRPDRCGRRRRRDLPPPLRARADREAEAALARPRGHPALLRRAGWSSPTSPMPTTRRAGQGRR